MNFYKFSWALELWNVVIRIYIDETVDTKSKTDFFGITTKRKPAFL